MARQDSEKAIKSYNTSHVTLENLCEYFEYHKDGYLINKKARGRTAKIGQRTCGENVKTYRQVLLNKVPTREHRIIWALHHGYWPLVIDHIDGDRLNNKIENLQDVDHKTNIRRASASKCGVYFHKTLKKWAAKITVMNKSVHLGLFENEVEARKARDAAELKFWGFNGHSN